MIFGKKPQNQELEKLADLLAKGITSLFKEKGIEFAKKPEVERKQLVEYEGRMRVDGMEKFDNEATYISAVNYFLNAADVEKQKSVGAVIVYVQQTYLPDLLKKLKYPPVDDLDDDGLRDSVGTLCNLIAGRFKSEIAKAGFVELEMSHFMHFKNSSFDGVAFCESEFDKYEIGFYIDKEKRMVVEMTMGIVPKR